MSPALSRVSLTLVLALLLPALAASAGAAVFTPTRLTDGADGRCDHDCSLREAVQAANALAGPDIVVLGPGTYELTLAGAGEEFSSTGDLDVRDDLILLGQGAGSTVVDANQLDRLLDVQAGVRLEVFGVTLRQGWAGTGGGARVAGELALAQSVVTASRAVSGSGGGIAALGQLSIVEIDRSTLHANQATEHGGGFYAEGTIEIVSSTLSGNLAGQKGGGLYATSKAVGEASNVTITLNQAAVEGGGVFVDNEPFITVDHPVFRNTILAGNSAPEDADCAGAALSGGHNLLGDGAGCPDFVPAQGDLEGTAASPLDPRLQPLAASGGTPVHIPADSPAVDRGSGCEPADQRGVARPEATCDIGAVELTDECVEGGEVLCLNGGRFRVQVAWTTAGDTGPGTAVPLTEDSGFFWFFDPGNIELTVKLLDGCGTNQRYWFFVSGLTNVGVTITVTDTAKSETKIYKNPLNKTFAPVLDTNAFRCAD